MASLLKFPGTFISIQTDFSDLDGLIIIPISTTKLVGTASRSATTTGNKKFNKALFRG